jgi:hypothetical protein
MKTCSHSACHKLLLAIGTPVNHIHYAMEHLVQLLTTGFAHEQSTCAAIQFAENHHYDLHNFAA